MGNHGTINLGLRIEQNTTLFGPLTGTNFADFIAVNTNDSTAINVRSSTFNLLGGNNTITASGLDVGIRNTESSTFSLGDGNNKPQPDPWDL